MSFLKRLFRRRLAMPEPEKAPPAEEYQLKRYYTGYGWRVVARFDKPKDPDELSGQLEPGRYRLDKVAADGKFEPLWTIGVKDEEGRIPSDVVPAGVGARRTEVKIELPEILKALKRFKEEGKAAFEFMRELFEPKTISEEDLANMMEVLRRKKEAIDKIFGTPVKTSGEVTYDGKVPVVLHPDVIPGVIDRSLDTVERRLEKWGVIEAKQPELKPKVPEEELIKLPERPEVGEPEKPEDKGKSKGSKRSD